MMRCSICIDVLRGRYACNEHTGVCARRGAGLYGCSLSYAEQLVASHGYFLLQLDVREALFVDKRYRELFGAVPHSVAEIYNAGYAKREIDDGVPNMQYVP